jgi:hypothetical protein
MGPRVRLRSNAILLVVAAVLSSAALVAGASAHHRPRLFTNAKGDHGGTYDHGRHTFFWFPRKKRFDRLAVCVWRHPNGSRTCKRFRIHRVPAASHRPWGVDFRTDRYFTIGPGKWDARFRHLGKNLSPVLGFHRG